MVDVYLAFDVEDPIHPEADDATMRLARDLSDVGVPGCFFMVAEKARLLRERGRRDVLKALSQHEIDYHGNYWFEFPELAMVYGERLCWDDAVQKALSVELPGLHDVAEITGQFPTAWVQHQGNTSPQTAYALRRAGVKVWNGGFGGGGDPLWVMDIFTVSRASHSISLQGRWGHFQFDPLEPGRTPPGTNPDEEFAAFQRDFEALLSRNPSHIVCLGHPTCWVMAEWWGWYDWSEVFRQRLAEAPYPRGWHFERVVKRSNSDSETHFQWTKRVAQWLASRGDVRVTTFGQVAKEHEEAYGAWLWQEEIAQVAAHLAQRLDPVCVGSVVLSAADALFLLAHAATFILEQRRLPDVLQVMRVLGPVEPVLRPAGRLVLKRQDLFVAARETYHHVLNTGRLPHAIKAHSVEMGPAELARALGLAGQALAETGQIPDRIEVPEVSPLPDAAENPFFRSPRVSSTNAPPGFRAQRIPELARLQSWSYRPARRRPMYP